MKSKLAVAQNIQDEFREGEREHKQDSRKLREELADAVRRTVDISSTVAQQIQEIEKLNKRLDKKSKSADRRRLAEEFAIDMGDTSKSTEEDEWWAWQADEPTNVPVVAAAVMHTVTPASSYERGEVFKGW